MSAIMKAALVTWMLDHKCKVEKVEPPEGEISMWTVTFQCPNQIGTTFRNQGVGKTECLALIDCMRRAGVYDIKARLFVAGFMAEHLAQRSAPGFLRRIENASS